MSNLVKWWIWVCAFASVAGWGLSAIGQLNRAGYAAAIAMVAIVLLLGRNQWIGQLQLSSFKKMLRRFRRPLPLAFLALAFLVFLGGVLHAPTNYTGLQYRLARVLQWLAHDGWWWVHTPNVRMNFSGCGIEWMQAPLLLFTRSDRVLFLVNFIPFLLLPGLIYRVFTQLGIHARVAWHWMWLLPTGYNFLQLAGSIGNDTFPVVFFLAALDFGLRARTSGKISDVWLSLLAAALLTGVKASNLPLLLPWIIAFLPSLPSLLVRRRMLGTVLIGIVAAVVSFLPTAVLNYRYSGDWAGATLIEPRLVIRNPFVGIYGNTFQLLHQNFAPPIFPMARQWIEQAPQFMPHFLVEAADKYFDNGFFGVGELPTEDWAGIGFGLSVLATVSFFAQFWMRRGGIRGAWTTIPLTSRLVFLGSWIALLAYAMKMGHTNAARVISPYYPLLIGSLVVGVAQSEIVRRRWWKRLASASLILAFAVLILSPDRPLWPAQSILPSLQAQYPNSAIISRALKVYTGYARRSDPLAEVRAMLPANVHTVGFIGTTDDMDISLWRPFGSRTVAHFFLTDPPEYIRQQAEFVVVGGYNLKLSGVTLDDWLQKAGAELVATTNATVKLSEGPQPWYLVRFRR